MKRIGNIYQKICSFENLYQAYLEARKCKRYRYEVLRFSAHLEEELLPIQRELEDKTYEVGNYHHFHDQRAEKADDHGSAFPGQGGTVGDLPTAEPDF